MAVSKDVGKKWGIVSLLCLIELLLVVIKLRGEATYNWATAFIPVWILLGLWVCYMVIQAGTSRNKSIIEEEIHDLSPHQVGFRKVLSLSWTWFLWVVLLIFFIFLASFLDDASATTDGSELVYPWIVYFAVVLLMVIVYAIISLCCPYSPSRHHHRHSKESAAKTTTTTATIPMEL